MFDAYLGIYEKPGEKLSGMVFIVGSSYEWTKFIKVESWDTCEYKFLVNCSLLFRFQYRQTALLTGVCS